MTSVFPPACTSDASGATGLAERARQVIPAGVNSQTRSHGAPHALASASGAYVTDSDGRRYLDYHAAFGAILLGHCHPEIDAAVANTRGKIDLVGYGVTEAEVELAELVVSVMPGVDQMVALNTGSEAVAYAIRLARAATERRLLIKFQGGFHGWSDPVARNVISTAELAYRMDPISAGILPEALESTLIAEFNDLTSLRDLYARYPDQIAAVIMEPIPHNVGALLPTREFVTGVRELTREHRSLLIFDEVITGFRHHLGGYQAVCGVTPDLTTFGKAMGNGYPVAGIGGRRNLMSLADGATGGCVSIMGTFNGNAMSCAAAIATIRYLQANPDFYSRTQKLGERARSGLRSVIAELGIDATVVGFGGTFSTYFGTGPDPITGYRQLVDNDAGAAVAFHRGMIERGFLMIPMALKRMHVSGSHTAKDIDLTIEAARDTLLALRAADRVPMR